MSAHPGDRLSAFLDGELPPSERAEVDAHVRACASCARALDELRAVDLLAREMPMEAAPAGYFDALPSRVRSRVRRPARARPVVLWAAAAAAALVVAVLAPLTLRRAESMRGAPAERAAGGESLPFPAPPTLARPLPAAPPAAVPGPGPEAQARLQDREEARLEDGPPPARALRPARAKVMASVPAGAAAAGAAPGLAPPAAPPAPVATTASSTAANSHRALDTFAAAPSPAGARPAEEKAESGRRGDTPSPVRKEAAPDEGLRPARERRAPVAGAVSHAQPGLSSDERYRALEARRATSAAEARALRDGWDAFAREEGSGPRADEARVRAIEASVTAWRIGADPADLTRARGDGRAYLTSEGALQRDRVRTLLETLPPSPVP